MSNYEIFEKYFSPASNCQVWKEFLDLSKANDLIWSDTVGNINPDFQGNNKLYFVSQPIPSRESYELLTNELSLFQSEDKNLYVKRNNICELLISEIEPYFWKKVVDTVKNHDEGRLEKLRNKQAKDDFENNIGKNFDEVVNGLREIIEIDEQKKKFFRQNRRKLEEQDFWIEAEGNNAYEKFENLRQRHELQQNEHENNHPRGILRGPTFNEMKEDLERVIRMSERDKLTFLGRIFLISLDFSEYDWFSDNFDTNKRSVYVLLLFIDNQYFQDIFINHLGLKYTTIDQD